MSTRAGFDYNTLLLGAENAQPLVFIRLDFPSWPVHLHTGVGVITWGNEDWIGAGHIGAIRPLRDSISGKSGTFELVLAPIPSTYVYDAINEPTRGRLVEMYFVNWADDDTGFAGGVEPFLFMRGRMGPPRFSLGRENVVSMVVEDVRALLGRVNGNRSTLLDHQESAPGDLFYEFLPAMLDHTFLFNGVEQGKKYLNPKFFPVDPELYRNIT